MGCGQTKENIEAEMLLLQLIRTEIQDERKAILKQLKEINGKKVIRPKIPDYLAKTDEASSKKKKENHKKKLRTKQGTKSDDETEMNKGNQSNIEEVNIN